MSYQEFDKDGNKKVECRLCGRYYHRLDVHLSSKHGTTVADYKAQHPGAETISDKAKLSAAKGQKSGGKALSQKIKQQVQTNTVITSDGSKDATIARKTARLRMPRTTLVRSSMSRAFPP